MNQFRPRGGFGSIPPVVKNLLIINVLAYVAMHAINSAFNYDISQNLALYFFKSEYFKPFQFISHMFMHSSFSIGHIFFNMFALWMFGKAIETMWGGKRFLIYYFVTGLGAAALHTLANWYSISIIENAADLYYNSPSPEAFMSFLREHFPRVGINSEYIEAWSQIPESSHYINDVNEFIQKLIISKINVPTVGASGAVFGVLLAFGMLFPNTYLYVYFAIPVKAKYFVMIYGAIELYAGVMNQPGDNIAHFAHLGGMIFGYFLIIYWKKKQFNK